MFFLRIKRRLGLGLWHWPYLVGAPAAHTGTAGDAGADNGLVWPPWIGLSPVRWI